MVRVNDPSHLNTIAIQRIIQNILIPNDVPQNDLEFSKSGQDGAVEYYMTARAARESYKATYDLLLPEVSNF